MAAIAHGVTRSYNAGTPFTYSTDATYQTVLTSAASNFVAGGKYLLLARIGNIQGGSTSLSVLAKTLHGSTDFPGSEMVVEPVNAGSVLNGQPYVFSTVFTQPGTAEDILIKVATEATGTVNAMAVSLTWIRLDADLTENTDWYFNDLATDDAMSTSFETRATVTVDEPGTWLIIGCEQIQYDDETQDAEMRLVEDPSGTPIQIGGLHRYEAKDATDQWVVTQFASRVITSGSVTFAVQDRGETSTAHDHLHSMIFALNLDLFDQSVVGYDADSLTPSTAGVNVTPDGWTNPTPDVTGDWLVVGQSQLTLGGTARGGEIWIETTADIGTSQDRLDQTADGPRQLHATDALGIPIGTAIYMIPLTATVVPAIKLYTDWAGTVSGGWANRFLAAFSMELAIAPTTDRHTQLSWAELEIPTAPRKTQVAWAELEIPTAPRKGQVAWAELEVPSGARRGLVAWAELEVPNAPRQVQISWAEFETPAVDKAVQISWAEFEVPGGTVRRVNLAWAELELPTAPRRGVVAWAEFEVPTAPRKGQVAWAELEIPTAPRKGLVSWAELEIPVGGRGVLVAWAELEIPNIPPVRAQISWAELELPTYAEARIIRVPRHKQLRRQGTNSIFLIGRFNFASTKDYIPVSSIIQFEAGTEDDVWAAVAAVWANRGAYANNALLMAALNAALTAAGYQAPGGKPL